MGGKGKGKGTPPPPRPGDSFWGRRTGHGVFVGNLPSTASTEVLIARFSEFGEVAGVDNHYLQGFAFINFATPQGKSRLMIEPEVDLEGQVLNVENRKGDSAGPLCDDDEVRIERQLVSKGKGKGGKGDKSGKGKGSAGPVDDPFAEKKEEDEGRKFPEMSAAEKRRIERQRIMQEKQQELKERTARLKQQEEEAARRAEEAAATMPAEEEPERGAIPNDWDATPGWDEPAPAGRGRGRGRGRGAAPPASTPAPAAVGWGGGGGGGWGVASSSAPPQLPAQADIGVQEMEETLADLQERRDSMLLDETGYAEGVVAAYRKAGRQPPQDMLELAAPVAEVAWSDPQSGRQIVVSASPAKGRVQYTMGRAQRTSGVVIVARDSDGSPYLEFAAGDSVGLPPQSAELDSVLRRLYKLLTVCAVDHRGFRDSPPPQTMPMGFGRGSGRGTSPDPSPAPSGRGGGRGSFSEDFPSLPESGRGYAAPPPQGRGRGRGRN
eukprot:TRINITY_DN3173_c0_g1_i1.p1 TRINITY_DN3173_c0_g1~~TRINITY_DN3173_c0_g1_i1.p1  ORF type:complete len:509 (+),score=138.96 TRINITY_DN3173_c0_g1_i1:49-1527(+)